MFRSERLIPKSTLRTLFRLRNAAIIAQLLVLVVVYYGLGIEIPMLASLLVVGLLIAVNGRVGFLLRAETAVSEFRFFCHLLLDVVALTIILYFNGGYTNPFISLYLLPLAITAAILPAIYTWGLAAICIACYSMLMFDYVPLPSYTGRLGNDFSLHTFGMWCSFVLSAVVISAFVVYMATALRRRDQRLARARVEAQRNERVVALGALAAGTAHELGTPLSTMAVLVDELVENTEQNPELLGDLRILADQISRCRDALTANLAEVGQPRSEHASRIALKDYLVAVVDQWRRMRPDINVLWNPSEIAVGVALIADNTLDQALISLFNNAADASPDFVLIDAEVRDSAVAITVEDRGHGFSDDIAQKFDQPYNSDKGPGRGLGLFLAKAVIERIGGRIDIHQSDNRSGTTVTVNLPVVMT